MRSHVTVLVLMILAAPAAGALVARAPSLPLVTEAFDPTDSELLLLLAREQGLDPTPLAAPGLADVAALPGLVMRMGALAGTPVAPEDAAQFAQLDARVAAPVATMLLAMEHAWEYQTQALSAIPREEFLAAQRAYLAGEPVQLALTPDMQEALVASAIMLMDTIDGIVVPALLAVPPEAWPPVAVADPAGVLFVGSPGNDLDTIGRLLSLDGGGDDVYRNYMGGAYADTNTNRVEYPVSIGLDLRGNDQYRKPNSSGMAFGAAFAGVGIMKDFSGRDSYACDGDCVGRAVGGVGYFRDVAGDDQYEAGPYAYGAVSTGIIATARDDAGDDRQLAAVVSSGYGEAHGVGLYWDRSGTDDYVVSSSVLSVFGFARGDAKGWFVSEGPETDSYSALLTPGSFQGRCNDCTWVDGRDVMGGRGNDNHGGLPYLLSKQDAL